MTESLNYFVDLSRVALWLGKIYYCLSATCVLASALLDRLSASSAGQYYFPNSSTCLLGADASSQSWGCAQVLGFLSCLSQCDTCLWVHKLMVLERPFSHFDAEKRDKEWKWKAGRTDRKKISRWRKESRNKKSNGHPKSEIERYKDPEEKGPTKTFFFSIFLQTHCYSGFAVEKQHMFSHCVCASPLPTWIFKLLDQFKSNFLEAWSL